MVQLMAGKVKAIKIACLTAGKKSQCCNKSVKSIVLVLLAVSGTLLCQNPEVQVHPLHLPTGPMLMTECLMPVLPVLDY
jgi:hypothetical protein